ncbi:MAG: hypothetical protein OSJ60_10335 [Lachnospiraceae bacterium]|jgi:hypothetical protein|nr:hypothetical protein [Lachnospiraceae bacterium]
MLLKIYQELVKIRKELQSIKSAMEPETMNIAMDSLTESLAKATDSAVHTLGVR